MTSSAEVGSSATIILGSVETSVLLQFVASDLLKIRVDTSLPNQDLFQRLLVACALFLVSQLFCTYFELLVVPKCCNQ